MNPSNSTATSANSKPAKAGKDAKEGKEGKEGKTKDAKKAKESSSATASGHAREEAEAAGLAIDNLAELTRTVARLVADVEALRQNSVAAQETTGQAAAASTRRSKVTHADSLLAALNADKSAVVALAFGAADDGSAPFATVADADALRAVDTVRLARIGYAFASGPKIALIRQLLDERDRTAAQLGEGAGLTTGSLYHHLRELVHAEVVQTSGRNQYTLTGLGRRMTLAFLALASDTGQRAG